MTKLLTTFISILCLCNVGHSQTIWDGPDLEFEKFGHANWTLESNQDRITENIWITRADIKGLFNIASEDEYINLVSPLGTEWAMGTTADIDNITFSDWKTAVNASPTESLFENMVVRLIEEDIYIDIKFIAWASEGTGGNFAYIRSTDPSLSVQNQKPTELYITPNPSADFFRIAGLSNGIQITAMDITGREIHDAPYTDRIDVVNWPKGLYIIKVMGVGTTKFVKK